MASNCLSHLDMIQQKIQVLDFSCFHRACAAFFAMSLRFLADRFAARTLPPLLAPSLLSATACGFFVSGGSGGAFPVTLSIMSLAIWVKSRFFPVLLARVGMPPI